MRVVRPNVDGSYAGCMKSVLSEARKPTEGLLHFLFYICFMNNNLNQLPFTSVLPSFGCRTRFALQTWIGNRIG